jgi:hypothetical protein
MFLRTIALTYLSFLAVSVLRSLYIQNWAHVSGVGVWIEATAYVAVVSVPLYFSQKDKSLKAMSVWSAIIFILLILSVVFSGGLKLTALSSVVMHLVSCITYTIPFVLGVWLGRNWSKGDD